MGWRKWTILDGDLARCSELQRPRRDAELRPCQWGDHLMRQHLTESGWSDRILSETGRAGLGTCSNRTVVVQ
jgi:hypothetical protein